MARVSKNTAAVVRADLVASGQIDQLAKTVGADGKARPARRKKTAPEPEAPTKCTPDPDAEQAAIVNPPPNPEAEARRAIDCAVKAIGPVGAAEMVLALLPVEQLRDVCDRALLGLDCEREPAGPDLEVGHERP